MRIDVCVPTLSEPQAEFEEMIRTTIPTNSIIYSWAKPLSAARQEMIDKVTTEFFAFVDTDVILLPNWFSQVTKLLDDHTGAVEGYWIYTAPEVELYQNAMRDLARLLGRRSANERLVRAFTGDTLIRTKAVRGIRIPPLQVYEDEYIRKYVEERGYAWKRTSKPVCLHNRSQNVSQAFAVGYNAHRLGMLTPRQALLNLALVLPKSCYAGAKVVAVQVTREALTTWGCLSSRFNLTQEKAGESQTR